MLRKYTAIVLICISGLIYAGHSFIPHLHHPDHSESRDQVNVGGHTDHYDQHDSDSKKNKKHPHKSSDEDSEIFDILAHFSHGEPFYKSDDGTEIKVDVNQKAPVLACEPAAIKWADYTSIFPQEVNHQHTEPDDYHSLSHAPSGLRAPPVEA